MRLRNKGTGEIGEIRYENHELYVDTDEGFTYWIRTIAELKEKWEDAEGINAPSTPLIKDEKIRKAVRAWARENLIEKVGFKLDRSKSQCACYFYDESCEICEFGLKFYLDIEHDKVYTIAELCGEEEE